MNLLRVRTCEECRYYGGGDGGLCVRYPPRVLSVRTPDGYGGHWWVTETTYLHVYKGDRACGEYRSKGLLYWLLRGCGR